MLQRGCESHASRQLTKLEATWAEYVEVCHQYTVGRGPLLGAAVICVSRSSLGHVRHAEAVKAILEWRVETFFPAADMVIGERELRGKLRRDKK